MSYIGNEPVVSATRTLTEYTATAGQTTFTAIGGYTVGFIDVIVNGAQLNSDDFTATNGSTIVLTNACAGGEAVRLVALGTFSVANIPSGALTSGAPTWSPTGGVSLPRIDSSTEGGQLNFNRASDNTGNWAIDSYGSGSTPSLRFIDGANVRAAIDGSGNVGIGGTPVSVASTKVLTVYDATEARLQLQNSTTGTTATDGSTIAVAGSDLYINNREAGNTLFYVNGAERMRIDSSGNLLVGTTTAGLTGSGFSVTTYSNGRYIDIGHTTGDTGSEGYARFVRGGTIVGQISSNGTSQVTYATSSDYRLKENIAPMVDALAKVQQLKPVTYNWKSDGSEGQGFIAHELAEIVPDCVTGEKDAVDEDGKPVYQGIDTSFLVATLTAAIQELKAELDATKAEVAALKGNV